MVRGKRDPRPVTPEDAAAAVAWLRQMGQTARLIAGPPLTPEEIRLYADLWERRRER